MKYSKEHNERCKYYLLPTSTSISLCKQCNFNFWTDKINMNISIAEYSKNMSGPSFEVQYKQCLSALVEDKKNRDRLHYYDESEILIANRDSVPHTITKGNKYYSPYKVDSEGFVRILNDLRIEIRVPLTLFTYKSEL